MNKIKYLLIVLLAVIIYSCAEDDFDNPPAPSNFINEAPELVDSIDNKTATLLKLNEAVAWDTLAWNPAQLYEGGGLVTHYSVQITDAGEDFSSYMEFESGTTSDTFIVITEGNLNTKLLENGYSPVQTYDLQLRIRSFVHEDLETVYTEAFPFSVTTYKDVPISETMYIYGNATTVGWDASKALLMYSDGGIHTGFTYLENNMKFRFLPQQDTLNNTYNSESIITYSSNVSAANDEMKNFVFTGTSGWYKIEANYLTSELIVEEHVAGTETYTYDYDNLYLVGDYNSTDGVWDAANAVPFTKVSEGLFKISTTLKDGAQFKFIGQQAWGDLEWANLGEGGNSGSLGPKGFNGNFSFDGGGETYNIVVNIKQGTYSIKAANIWLVGSINGWNNYGQYLAAIGNDVHVGYQYLIGTDEFKILVERNSWDGLWGAGASPGEIADGGGNIVVSGLPTYTGEGFYEIKFDMINKTVVLTPVAIGVIGSAQAGDWSTDVDLTFNTTTKIWEGQVTFFATGEYKFRANDDWAISFGGSLDNIEYNGGNLATPGAGTYDVTLDLSGAEKFSATVTLAK